MHNKIDILNPEQCLLIENNWHRFPYKFEYVLYKIYSSHSHVSRAFFNPKHLCYKGRVCIDKLFVIDVLEVSEEEINKTLKINTSKIRYSTNFTPSIFNLEGNIRAEKLDQQICLYFIRNSPQGVFFHINEVLEKILLNYELEAKLKDNNKNIEETIKI